MKKKKYRVKDLPQHCLIIYRVHYSGDERYITEVYKDDGFEMWENGKKKHIFRLHHYNLKQCENLSSAIMQATIMKGDCEIFSNEYEFGNVRENVFEKVG